MYRFISDYTVAFAYRYYCKNTVQVAFRLPSSEFSFVLCALKLTDTVGVALYPEPIPIVILIYYGTVKALFKVGRGPEMYSYVVT